MTDRTPGPEGSTHPPEAVPADEPRGDGVPDILEIFGAAPLVRADREGADDEVQEEAEIPTHELEEELELVGTDTDDGERAADAPPPATDDQPAPVADAAPAAATPPAPLDDPAPVALAADVDLAAAQIAALEALDARVSGTLQLLEQRMGSLEETLDGLSKQSSFLPPKLRGLGKKVDELSSALGDGRLRELFGELVGLVDLSETGLAAPADDPDAARRALGAVVQNLRRTLENHGLVSIETDGAFDPTRHQAVERRPVSDAAHDGMVVEVFRRGWRDAHAVLRYADVAVGAHDPKLAAQATPADASSPDDERAPTDAELAPATLTPGNLRAPAAPRRDPTTDSPADGGDTDRTAAKASSRNTKTDDKDDA